MQEQELVIATDLYKIAVQDGTQLLHDMQIQADRDNARHARTRLHESKSESLPLRMG